MSDFFTDRGMEIARLKALEEGQKTPPVDSRTECKRYFDELIATRRAAGRKTYGQGLEHTDPKWHWPTMATEEAMDLAQYLTAENLRLKEENARLKAHLQGRSNSGIHANSAGSTWKSEGGR